jgi:hypothetical protein
MKFDFFVKFRRSKSNKIELNYIIPSHVLVRLLDTSQEIRVKSKYGSEILDVKLMGKDRFLVSKTNETVIISELNYKRMLSEKAIWKFIKCDLQLIL